MINFNFNAQILTSRLPCYLVGYKDLILYTTYNDLNIPKNLRIVGILTDK